MSQERAKKPVRSLRLLKRLLAAPFIVVAVVVILVEDWLWDDLARLAAFFGRLPGLRSVEAFIAGLPPYPALLFFATPSLLLIPLKLISLYFISHGRAALGLLAIVIAKFAGTALVARIFALTRPALLQMLWFAWLYSRLGDFKSRVYGAIKSTTVYKVVHEAHLRIRAGLRSWLSRRGIWRKRWLASLRLSRHRKETQA